jgi:protein-S-isoprenylcysteine O-methyltransferase Ste14
MPSLITVLCLWAAWFASWMLTRLWAKPTVAAPKPGSQRLYSVVSYLGMAMLVVQDPHSDVVRMWVLPPVVNWSLVAVAAAGFGVCWWARIYMGRTWSWHITRKEDHQIVDTGPYALVRHPIYTGLIIAAAATAVLQARPWAWVGFGLFVLGLWIKARSEEIFLRAELGEDYGAYARRTGMLLPGL